MAITSAMSNVNLMRRAARPPSLVSSRLTASFPRDIPRVRRLECPTPPLVDPEWALAARAVLPVKTPRRLRACSLFHLLFRAPVCAFNSISRCDFTRRQCLACSRSVAAMMMPASRAFSLLTVHAAATSAKTVAVSCSWTMESASAQSTHSSRPFSMAIPRGVILSTQRVCAAPMQSSAMTSSRARLTSVCVPTVCTDATSGVALRMTTARLRSMPAKWASAM